MVRRCWVNSQCRGVLLIWIIVGQGPIALAVGAGGGCLDIFSLIYHFSFLSPSLWETARYRLKYCLKGPLSPKQPTNRLRLKLLIQFLLRICALHTTYLHNIHVTSRHNHILDDYRKYFTLHLIICAYTGYKRKREENLF